MEDRVAPARPTLESSDPTDKTTPRCPACHELTRSSGIGRHDQWTLYACGVCGVQYFWPARNPGPDWYEANDMYERRDVLTPDWLWYHEQGLRMLPKRVGRLLDVGCGTGNFVAAAARRGFDAVGIDFSEKAVERGRTTYGVDLHRMTTADARARFGDGAFDVVTAFEVLEHMDDVRSFVDDLTALLHPGGRLIISVPNRERRPWMLNEGDLPPHHFTRWDRRSLEGLLERHGLARIRSVTCSPRVTIKSAILFFTSAGIVTRMVDEAHRTGNPGARSRLRTLARLLARSKDVIAGALAIPPSIFLGRWLRGPMLVTSGDHLAATDRGASRPRPASPP